MKIMVRRAVACLLAAFLAACVSFPPAPAALQEPYVGDNFVAVDDGAHLGLRTWRAASSTAVIVAVHGMNDYANAFAEPGAYWAQHGISVYAYDQRGFGASPDFGRWPGAKTMTQDLRAVIAAVRAENPGLPVYALGHSMGAAVVITAMSERRLDVDGVILAAPGVWGSAQMPVLYRAALNIAAMTAPGKTLTGERSHRQATDNIEILRQMYADSKVIKDTRLDAILGVVRLMGAAWRASDEVGGDILFIYGNKDQIIPIETMRKAADRLCGNVAIRAYPDGWHLLFRDLQAQLVWMDVENWIAVQADKSDPQVLARGAGPADTFCASAGV